MKALNLRNKVVLAMAATVGTLAAGVANADYFATGFAELLQDGR